MGKLAMFARLKLQLCAILSQEHRHMDALKRAREAVQISHLLISDMLELCVLYIHRMDINKQVEEAKAKRALEQAENLRSFDKRFEAWE